MLLLNAMTEAALTFTIDSLPGLVFEAHPLSSPPAAGSVVFLYGDWRLVAVAEYQGGDVWNVVHQHFPAIEPTHWVACSPAIAAR